MTAVKVVPCNQSANCLARAAKIADNVDEHSGMSKNSTNDSRFLQIE